jgi:ribosomal protein S18 acetylase RimI-like enzyme
MAVRIAPLRLEDYEDTIALWRRAGLTNRVNLRDSRRAFARQLRSNRGLYLGAFDGKRLVGTVLGTHDTRKGWINRLAVDPAYQRRGVGTRLLRASEKALVRKGMKVISALVTNGNDPSLNLFRRSGYLTVTDMTYVRKKLDPDA